MGLSFALAKNARSHKLNDGDLISALTALAKTYSTLVNSGLLYETSAASVMQQSVAAELQSMVKEYRDTEQKNLGYSRLRDGDVLRALVFLVRTAHGRTSGRPKSRGFVDFLLAQFPESPATVAHEEVGGRIILP